MPIRKHGRGWEVRIQHGGRRYSKTVATRSDALYLEAKLRQRLNDSRAGRTPAYGLEEALKRWLTGEAKTLKSQETVVATSRAILPYITGRALHEIPDVARTLTEKELARGSGPAWINRQLATLKRIAKLAYKRWNWLENDLGAKIEMLPGEVKRTEWVTPEQGRKLMAAASGNVRQMIRWALLTGLRRGELLSLTQENFIDGAIYLKDTKSGKPRAVPVPPELDPKRFPFGVGESELGKGFQNARRLARMPHIRFHDLRRSYGTWLIQRRVDASVVRDLLGHSTIAMTSRYLGTSVRHLRLAVKTLPRLGRSRGRKAVSHRAG